MSPTGERTPEDAARGDVAQRFVQVIGVVVRGDQAIVAQLMNDIPPHEVETAFCFREPDGSWVGGSSGNSTGGYLPTGKGVGTVLTWEEAPEGARAARFTYGDQEQVVQVERGCVVAVFDDVSQDHWPFDGPRLTAWVDMSGVDQPVEQHEIPERIRERYQAFVEDRGSDGSGAEDETTRYE
jgi:hypothetical protein